MRGRLFGLVLCATTGCGHPVVSTLSDFEATDVRAHDAAFTWSHRGDPAASLRCEAHHPGEAHVRELRGAERDDGVVLHGLLADTTYDCALTDGVAWLELRFTTAAPIVPDWRVEGDPDAVWGAWTLLNQFADHGARDHVITVFDPEGRVRLAHRMPDGLTVGVDATLVDRDHLLLGGGTGLSPALIDLHGDDVWRLPTAGPDERYHHDAELAPDGTVLVLRDEPQTSGAASFLGLRIEAWDPVAQVVTWSWSSQAAVDQGLLPVRPGDAWHSNALQRVVDSEGVGLMVSQAETARILRVDQATGAISWQLGAGLDFELLGGDWFYGAHDPEWLGDLVWMHDNGRDRPEGDYSRVVTYRIDRAARTAEELWSWTEPGWHQVLFGDTDRLPDGHVLVARGHCQGCPSQTNPDQRTDVLALDPATGSITWRLWTDDPAVGLYRAERIEACALFDHRGYCPMP